MIPKNRGFTLIELLLVIAIIVVILMLTLPTLVTVRRKALILSCQQNMHQISVWIEAYKVENSEIIPYLFYAAEGMLDPEHMTDPETQLSGLAKIIKKEDRGILRCPADTGYLGADYELTSPNHTCFSSFGQSYTYNNSLYTDLSSPYYNEGPIRFGQIQNPEQVVLVSDFSSVWHGAAGSGSKGAKYFLNIMYFDGHVQGKAFVSDQEAKTYRNNNSRWWD